MADYLHGLVDIHNHILPGIDDGAKTVEESIGLINGFRNLGITNFICTPHIMHNYYQNTPETIKSSYLKLQVELKRRNLDNVHVDFAAEHMIDENFETILEDKNVVPIQSRYLLVEMSYLQPSINFDAAITKVFSHNYFPILAHPERYAYFHQRKQVYSSLKAQGVLFQVNLLSFASEVYGKEVQKCAQNLLGNGLVDFIASDVHNIRQLSLIKDVKISNSMLQRILPIIEKTIHTFY